MLRITILMFMKEITIIFKILSMLFQTNLIVKGIIKTNNHTINSLSSWVTMISNNYLKISKTFTAIMDSKIINKNSMLVKKMDILILITQIFKATIDQTNKETTSFIRAINSISRTKVSDNRLNSKGNRLIQLQWTILIFLVTIRINSISKTINNSTHSLKIFLNQTWVDATIRWLKTTIIFIRISWVSLSKGTHILTFQVRIKALKRKRIIITKRARIIQRKIEFKIIWIKINLV